MDTEIVAPLVEPAAPLAETTPDIAPEMSIEDFKSAYPKAGKGRSDEDDPPAPRHRARSQQATPTDVTTIGELTKRIKEAEARDGADIVQIAGESNRVYELRRRAELAERRTMSVAPASATPIPAPAIPTARPAVQAFVPAVKDAATDPEPDPTKYEDLTKYFRDQALWAGRETLRQARVEEQQTRQTHDRAAEIARLNGQWVTSVTSAKAKYSDFEAVAFGPLKAPGWPQLVEIPQGSLIDAWILERPYGADVLYTLKKTPAEFARIFALPVAEQVEELTLLGQRLKARTPAVTTGAAAAPLAQPVSRPPTPVRTGPMRTSDDAPPDPESLSLSDFSAAYGSGKRRR